VKRLFTDKQFKSYWPGLVKLGQTAGARAGYLYGNGIPALKRLFTSQEFKSYWPGLVKLGQAAGERASPFFYLIFLGYKNYLLPKSLKVIGLT